MIAKIEKLIDSLQLLADMAAVALQHVNNPQQVLSVEGAAAAPAPAAAPKKARAPKTEPKAAAPEQSVEDQLGLGAAEPKPEAPKQKELTDKELQARVEEVTKQYVALCKNEAPVGGKNAGQVRAIALLQGTFKAQSLPLMSREQKVEWIATMEKWIAEYK